MNNYPSWYDKEKRECRICNTLMPDDDIKLFTLHEKDAFHLSCSISMAYPDMLKKETIIMEDTNKDLMTKDVAPTMVGTLTEIETRYKQLQEFIQKQMIEDEDYGTIPGCTKPSLFKSGAEKLLELYGYAVSDIQITKNENWDIGFFAYEIKAVATSKRSGQIVGTGIGACNSKENKYTKQDPYTIQNTLLKMAKKRAVVDLALLVTRSSALFTQDMEDIENGDKQPPIVDNKPKQAYVKGGELHGMATKKQVAAIFAICKHKGIVVGTIYEAKSINSFTELTKQQASDLIDSLQV